MRYITYVICFGGSLLGIHLFQEFLMAVLAGQILSMSGVNDMSFVNWRQLKSR